MFVSCLHHVSSQSIEFFREICPEHIQWVNGNMFAWAWWDWTCSGSLPWWSDRDVTSVHVSSYKRAISRGTFCELVGRSTTNIKHTWHWCLLLLFSCFRIISQCECFNVVHIWYMVWSGCWHCEYVELSSHIQRSKANLYFLLTPNVKKNLIIIWNISKYFK